MKKLSILLVPFLLAACNGSTLPGVGQVGMSGGVSNASIDIAITTATDSSGNTVPNSIQSTVVQPNVNFTVAPSSLGVTLTSFNVRIVDSAGVQFAGSNGQYTRSMSARVAGGYACKSGTAIDYTTDQCDYTNKIPYNRAVTLDSLPLIQGNVGEAIAAYVFDNFGVNGLVCNTPSLRMDVTFSGYDDLNRGITPIVIKNAPLTIMCK